MYIIETKYTVTVHDWCMFINTRHIHGTWKMTEKKMYTSKKAITVPILKKMQNTILQLILLVLKGTRYPQCWDSQQWPTESLVYSKDEPP